MTTVLRPLLWPGSLGGEILFTLFGIFKFFIAVQFLAPIVLLGVWALPATSSTDGGGGQPPNFIPTSETVSSGPQTSQNPSSSLSTPSFSTSATHPSATGSSSGSSQMSDGQLTILLSGKFDFISYATTIVPSSLRHRCDKGDFCLIVAESRFHLYIRFLGEKSNSL